MPTSSDDRIFERARNETINYHRLYYSGHQLFEENSWLARPDAGLMQIVEKELLPRASHLSTLKILDLGCGVGRNAVPMAMALAKAAVKAKIIGVDLLPESIELLVQNSIAYGVGHIVEGLVADNDQFEIFPGGHDLIAAISVLEHCSGSANVVKLLDGIARGLKPAGLVRIEMTTNRHVIDLETKLPVPTHVETPLSERQVTDMLKQAFAGFALLELEVFPYEEILERDGRKILWQSKQVSFSARRN